MIPRSRLTYTPAEKTANTLTNLSNSNQKTVSNTSAPLTTTPSSTTDPGPIPGVGRAAILAAGATGASPNVLHKFASYNYVLTLAALSSSQASQTTMLSMSEIQNIVARTGGDWENGGRRASTAFGKFDFFIEDLVINTTYGFPERIGNSFSTEITFKVTEPYSMGLFITALQAASQQASGDIYQNYREAAYAICIEFKGWDDTGKSISDSASTRIIPIKIVDMTFVVNQAGAVYSIRAIPYQEIAYTDTHALAFKDVQITGSTVQELLTSLQNHLDNRLEEIRKNFEMLSIDEIYVETPANFTNPPGFNAGPLWTAEVFTDHTDAGVKPQASISEVYDATKNIYRGNKIRVQEVGKTFHFKQDSKIQDILNEIVLRSSYIKNQIVDSKFKTDSNGMIDWWRIEVFAQDLEFNKKLNRQNRRIVYRAVPYKVHVSRLLPPGEKSPGVSSLIKNVPKVYNYIYTGQNTDVLNFNIEYNLALYHDLTSDLTNNTRTENPSLSATAGEKDPTYLHYKNEVADAEEVSRVSSYSGNSKNAISNNAYGGSGSDDALTVQIKNLKKILENPMEMLEINLEIMGDPYYIPSSGMGNQIGSQASFNTMSDGSLNYQSGEVDFIIIFKSPVDLNLETGLYKFDTSIDTFSGLYQLIDGECRFTQGRFTNVLRAFRRSVQQQSTTTDTAATPYQEAGIPKTRDLPFVGSA